MRTLKRIVLIAVAVFSCTASSADDSANRPLRWQVSVAPSQPRPGDIVEVVFSAEIAPGWILYSSDFAVDIGPRPAKFTFDANPSFALIGTVQSPGSQRKRDHTFGTEYTYFAGHAEFRQKARVIAPLENVTGRIDAQTCFEESGLCELHHDSFNATP